jgi:hypothetical protein
MVFPSGMRTVRGIAAGLHRGRQRVDRDARSPQPSSVCRGAEIGPEGSAGAERRTAQASGSASTDPQPLAGLGTPAHGVACLGASAIRVGAEGRFGSVRGLERRCPMEQSATLLTGVRSSESCPINSDGLGRGHEIIHLGWPLTACCTSLKIAMAASSAV